MRRVIGIGETILDILFRDGQPYTALPGGSIFNTLVSLSRVGVQTSFIGELGDDRVGRIIRDFMQQNGMSTDYMDSFSEGLSPVSLAFLDEGQGTDYMFYTNRSKRRSNMALPDIQPDDIVLFGSYYALNPDTRDRVMDLVQYARERRAIVYYDPNFRKAHAHEAIQLRATVMDNYEAADLVRGSDEDFVNLYKKTDPDEVYREFRYTDAPYVSSFHLEGIEPNVVMFDSMSKRYSECGIRVGAIVTRNARVRKSVMKWAQARLSPPLLGQIVAEASIDAPESYLKGVYEEYIQRRDFLVKRINEIPGCYSPLPMGAFYTVAKLPVDDADKFCAWCLRDFSYEGQTVMMAPASGFYVTPGYGRNEVRIAYVLERDELARALDVLEAALTTYRDRWNKR